MENRMIDFSKVEDGGKFLSNEGDYTFTITSYEKGESSKKGTPYHRFHCVTVDGETTRFDLFITDKAMWRYKALLKAVGAPTDRVMNIDELPEKLVGKEFVGVVKEESYNVIDALTGDITETKSIFKIVDFK